LKKKGSWTYSRKTKTVCLLTDFEKKHEFSKIEQNSKKDWCPEMALGLPKFGQNVLLTLKNCRMKFYDIWFDFVSEKKKMVKNGQNGRNFCKKMKFKIRLVAGNGIRPAKIRPEGPFNPLESSCKIL
jgi:hypothetical protein